MRSAGQNRRVGKGAARAVPTRATQHGGHASLCPPYEADSSRPAPSSQMPEPPISSGSGGLGQPEEPFSGRRRAIGAGSGIHENSSASS
jgi:hypothetical protein